MPHEKHPATPDLGSADDPRLAETLGTSLRLQAALQYRAPRLELRTGFDGETGCYLSVLCRDGAMRIAWAGTTYRWRAEPDGPWERLSADPVQAADDIALGLDVDRRRGRRHVLATLATAARGLMRGTPR